MFVKIYCIPFFMVMVINKERKYEKNKCEYFRRQIRAFGG